MKIKWDNYGIVNFEKYLYKLWGPFLRKIPKFNQ